MANLGYLSPDRLGAVVGETVRFEKNDFPLEAPHLVDFVMMNPPEDKTKSEPQ